VVAPEVLLLDEPSVGVDPVSRRELWRMVRDLQGTGIAVLWSTAYLDEAERCDHVMLLHEGRLLFDGIPGDLTARETGRTWRMAIPASAAEKRRLRRAAAALPGVVDAEIQGRALRLVVEPGSPPPELPDLRAEPAAPRLEDAYLAMLRSPRRAPPPVPPIADTGDGDLIVTRNLTRRFGSFTAVDGISFSVGRGEIFGLLGPNGAGKSTTFKMLCGLLAASGGEATVAGFDLSVARADARGRLGYMAQKFAYIGHLTVLQNMRFAAGVYGLGRDDAGARVEEAIDAYGLAPYRHAPCGLLPLGIKQRMALACAVLHRPAILFLDEPTSGVDPVTRREFWLRINAMADAGMTILVTSHFIDEAEYCDRLAIIYRGKMIGIGSPEEIKAAHDRTGGGLEAAFIALVEDYDREHPQ
jgi:ABC-2 type transport system ATP-binding protein